MGMKGRKFVKKNYGLKVKVGGKNLDKVIYDAARLAIKGKGDGKISVADTKMLVKAVRPTKDGRSSYDKLEKDTVAYVRANFTFTPAADKAFLFISLSLYLSISLSLYLSISLSFYLSI